MTNEEINPVPETEEEEQSTDDFPFRVILFNDDWHTFDEVITQIIKATECSFQRARTLTFEVHVKGKAEVFTGSMQKCLKVTSILEEIELHTQIVS